MKVTCPICHRAMMCDNIEMTKTEVVYTYTCDHWSFNENLNQNHPPLTFQIKGQIIVGGEKG